MTDEQEVDLDWGLVDAEDPDAEEATASEGRSRDRTPVPFPSKPTDHDTWGDYFADVKRRDKARKASQVSQPSTLVSTGEPESIPASPKAIIAAVDSMGWMVTVREWTMHHADEYYAGDSKATGASAGDLKKAAHDTRHLGVLARKEGARLGFYAEWLLGTTPKGAPSAKWGHAIVVDPVGLPRYLQHSYAIDKTYAKSMGIAHVADEITARLVGEYNDGAQYLAKTLVFEAAGELTLWLEDWQAMLVPGYERPVKKPKKIKQSEMGARELLAAGEWVA